MAESIHTGDLKTFGQCLDHMNLWGSDVNPNNMNNNCVSVSLCRLLGYANVYDCWGDTTKHNLPDQPLNIAQIVQLLAMTGWNFRWQLFEPQPAQSETAFQLLLSRMQLNSNLPSYPVIAYIRSDKTGHAVNGSFESQFGRTVLTDLRDYQQSTSGATDRADLEKSVAIMTFSMQSAVDKANEQKLINEWLDRMKRNILKH